MDLDEGAGLEGHWPHPGAARADDGEARRLSGDLPISLTRWEPLRAYVPTMSALELIIMLLFFRSANTVDNKARFADLGITFHNYRAARFCETLVMSSMITMRRGMLRMALPPCISYHHHRWRDRAHDHDAFDGEHVLTRRRGRDRFRLRDPARDHVGRSRRHL